MAVDVRDVVSAQIEFVAPQVEDFVQKLSVFGELFKSSAQTVTVSRYGYRHPIELYRGGASAKVSLNEGTSGSGAFPIGTMPNLTHILGAYFSQIRTYRISDETIDTSSSEGQSRYNALTRMVADAMVGQAEEEDIQLHGDGTGVLTNASSAPAATGGGTSSSTLTFAAATDYLRTARLRPGMVVEIWSDGLTVKRASTAPLIITDIDPSSGVVTFNQSVAAIADSTGTTGDSTNGDVIVIQGITAYGPATPTSFVSTYPQLGTSFPQYGIGGDSFRHGIEYVNDDTSSNYFYSRLKSSFSVLKANVTDAGGNDLDWAHGRILQSKVNARFGVAQNPQQVIGLIPEAQAMAIENLGISATQIQLPAGQDKSVSEDLAAFERKVGRSISYCGIRHYVDPRIRKDRIEYLAMDRLYKIQSRETGFVDGGDTGYKYMYRARYATNAQPMSASEFYLVSSWDALFAFPGRHMSLRNLKVDPRLAAV